MAISISKLDVADVAYLSFLLGVLSTVVTTGIAVAFFANRQQKFQKLVRWTEHLISYKDQIVTVSDLALENRIITQGVSKILR